MLIIIIIILPTNVQWGSQTRERFNVQWWNVSNLFVAHKGMNLAREHYSTQENHRSSIMGNKNLKGLGN